VGTVAECEPEDEIDGLRKRFVVKAGCVEMVPLADVAIVTGPEFEPVDEIDEFQRADDRRADSKDAPLASGIIVTDAEYEPADENGELVSVCNGMDWKLDTGFDPDNATGDFDAAGRIPSRELSTTVKDPELSKMIEVAESLVDLEAELEAAGTDSLEMGVIETGAGVVDPDLTSETEAASTSDTDIPAELPLLTVIEDTKVLALLPTGRDVELAIMMVETNMIEADKAVDTPLLPVLNVATISLGLITGCDDGIELGAAESVLDSSLVSVESPGNNKLLAATEDVLMFMLAVDESDVGNERAGVINVGAVLLMGVVDLKGEPALDGAGATMDTLLANPDDNGRTLVGTLTTIAAVVEAAVLEAGLMENTLLEATPPEAALMETALLAGAVLEPAVLEAVVLEAAVLEAAVPEAGVLEAAVLEAGVLEAGVLEAGVLEAALLEAALLEAALLEAALLEAALLEAVLFEAALVGAEALGTDRKLVPVSSDVETTTLTDTDDAPETTLDPPLANPGDNDGLLVCKLTLESVMLRLETVGFDRVVVLVSPIVETMMLIEADDPSDSALDMELAEPGDNEGLLLFTVMLEGRVTRAELFAID